MNATRHPNFPKLFRVSQATRHSKLASFRLFPKQKFDKCSLYKDTESVRVARSLDLLLMGNRNFLPSCSSAIKKKHKSPNVT